MPSEFPYASVHEFLREHKVIEKGQEAIAVAKELYWKKYHQHQYQTRKSTHHRVNLCLKRTIYEEMQKSAARRKVSVSDFAREAISLRLGQQPRMDEGTKEFLRALSGMESKLETYLRNNGQVPNELPEMLMILRDMYAHIEESYDLQRKTS